MKNILRQTSFMILLFFSLFIAGCDAASTTTEKPSAGNVKTDQSGNIEYRYIEVRDKRIKRYDDKDKFIISTQSGLYEVTDSILNMRLNSADIYADMRIGHCYKITIDALSFRSSFLSTFENIITADEVSCDKVTLATK